jgi:predicted amidohydrolase YtcJ
MDPMVGIYTALTRANLDGSDAWVPEERVDLMTALRAYTEGSAYVAFADDRRGRLTPGMQADVIVLSEDLEAAAAEDPRRILDVRVTASIVDGELAAGEL